MRLIVCLCVIVLAYAAPALADPASIGVNLNVVAGSFRQSQQSAGALPTTPIPMFVIRVPFKQFAIEAEGVPPIGPVQYGDGLGNTQSTKLSYLNAELTWRTPSDLLEFGVGTSLLNQITYYNSFPVTEQFSRVAGFRFSVRARVENTSHAVTDITVAVSPAMHGVQYSKILYSSARDPELASLVDITAKRAHQHGRFQFSYGIRYLNYVAHFEANGAPADHERGIMPFAGVAFSIGH